jgi:hypothetical protein
MGNMDFFASHTGDKFGFRPYSDTAVIVYKNDVQKVIQVQPDTKPGYCYRILKTCIKCKNTGVADLFEFVRRDMGDYKPGDEIHATFADFVARRAFEYCKGVFI